MARTAKISHISPDAKDGPYGDKTIYVGRSVERIKGHDVLPPLLGWNLHHRLVLLGDEGAGREGGAEGIDEEVVGQDVQLLLLVSCHVGAASDAIPGGDKTRSCQTVPHREADVELVS